jgi:hypothetical protein
VAVKAKDPGVTLTPLQRLADTMLARIEPLVDRAAERMQEQLPSYARVRRDELAPIILANARAILYGLLEPGAAPTAGSPNYQDTGETRARQGITSDEMLHAWRIGLEAMREEARPIAQELGLGDAEVLEFVEATLRLGDVGMLATASAHREAELEMASHEQHHRANLVRGVLFGTLSPAAIRVQTAAYGLDPAGSYCAVRARPTEDITVRSLERQLGLADSAGPRRGMGALLDGDLAGFILVPVRHTGSSPVGVGPPAPLHTLEYSFRLATRAFETAVALGRTGTVGIESLGLAPAVIADGDIGDALAARIIEPVLAQGRTGAVLLETVARYLDNDLRLEVTAAELFLHVNTVRYRLRRFEELTDTSLRRVDDLAEIWWSIRRRRLTSTADGQL